MLGWPVPRVGTGFIRMAAHLRISQPLNITIMSKITITAARIKELKPLEIANNEDVRRQFISIYGSLWGATDADAVCERESIFFNRLLRDNEKLLECTPISVYVAFIDLAVCGLTLEPGVRALAYLQPRGYKTGQKDGHGRDIYEQRCSLTISGYGELVQRTRVGQIRHADNPVIVYEGDSFSFSDRDGRKSVDYTLNLGHNVQKPIACFMRITRADGTSDYGVMLPEGWGRLMGYSEKANTYRDPNGNYVKRANPLYSSGIGGTIDTGFLIAKCIKHSFKTYPKVRIGRGTTYEADQQPQQEEDYYNMEEDRQTAGPQSFSPADDTSAGVVIDPDTDDNSDGAF